MDANRFDSLARIVGHSRSRRQVLRSLAGSAAGVLLLGGREASADACKADGKACKKDSQCCSRTCAGGSGTGSTAHSDGVCQPATRCAAPKTLCGTNCVDLSTDPANCGACGNPCLISGACQNGACCRTGTCGSLTCPATADTCSGPGLSCGSSDISCYCHNVEGASVCGSRTGCQQCNPGDQCTYNVIEGVPTYGTCISCNGCTSCFQACSARS